MRAQYGAVVSVVRVAAYERRILAHAEVQAGLEAADRGAALVVAPARVRIQTTDDVSRRRVEARWGLG